MSSVVDFWCGGCRTILESGGKFQEWKCWLIQNFCCEWWWYNWERWLSDDDGCRAHTGQPHLFLLTTVNELGRKKWHIGCTQYILIMHVLHFLLFSYLCFWIEICRLPLWPGTENVSPNAYFTIPFSYWYFWRLTIFYRGYNRYISYSHTLSHPSILQQLWKNCSTFKEKNFIVSLAK